MANNSLNRKTHSSSFNNKETLEVISCKSPMYLYSINLSQDEANFLNNLGTDTLNSLGVDLKSFTTGKVKCSLKQRVRLFSLLKGFGFRS